MMNYGFNPDGDGELFDRDSFYDCNDAEALEKKSAQACVNILKKNGLSHMKNSLTNTRDVKIFSMMILERLYNDCDKDQHCAMATRTKCSPKHCAGSGLKIISRWTKDILNVYEYDREMGNNTMDEMGIKRSLKLISLAFQKLNAKEKDRLEKKYDRYRAELVAEGAVEAIDWARISLHARSGILMLRIGSIIRAQRRNRQ